MISFNKNIPVLLSFRITWSDYHANNGQPNDGTKMIIPTNSWLMMLVDVFYMKTSVLFWPGKRVCAACHWIAYSHALHDDGEERLWHSTLKTTLNCSFRCLLIDKHFLYHCHMKWIKTNFILKSSTEYKTSRFMCFAAFFHLGSFRDLNFKTTFF